MAGEFGDVQHPFSLSFQVDALHSSSISFGRFDLESLSWERRSSFSHNRYLEEVEKYARPGSVTEKKEYFEAHFRKRALLRQASSVSQAELQRSNSDSSSFGTSTCEENDRDLIDGEKPQQKVENSDCCRFDESPKGSIHDEDLGVIEYEGGLAHNFHSQPHTESLSSLDDTGNCSGLEVEIRGGEHHDDARATDSLELQREITQDTLCPVKDVECEDYVETMEKESTLEQVSMFNAQQNVNLETESDDPTPDILMEQSISGSSAGETIDQSSKMPTLPTTLKSEANTRTSGLGSGPAPGVLLNKGVDVKKGISPTNGCREKQSSLRTRALKQNTESINPSLQSSLRQAKKENPQSLKLNSPHAKKSEKELIPKRATTPKPSTPERSESRRPRSAMSSTRQIASSRKEIGQSVRNPNFRSSGGADKKRDKTPDITRLSIKPAMKENSKLCSVSNTLLQVSNRDKVVTSNRSSIKASTRSLQSENQTRTRPKSSSNSRVKQAVSPNKSRASHLSSSLETGSKVHKITNANCSSRAKICVTEANQRKGVTIRKEGANDRKPKARENGQITMGKLLDATQKNGLGRSAHGALKKDHHAETITATPRIRPGRIDNPSLRKTIGH